MKNIFIQNFLNTLVFELQVILLIMKGTQKSESSHYLAIGIVLEKKLFTRTPQSNDISQLTDKAANIQKYFL